MVAYSLIKKRDAQIFLGEPLPPLIRLIKRERLDHVHACAYMYDVWFTHNYIIFI